MADISGSTKIMGVPTQCTVNLCDAVNGRLYKTQLSDPVTGEYTFKFVPTYTTLNIVAIPVDLEAGIAPQISGPFKAPPAQPSELSSGYIFLTYSSSGSSYQPYYDKTATGDPDWGINFAESIALPNADDRLRYSYNIGGQSSLPWLVSNYPGFNKNWTLGIVCGSATITADYADIDYEFLDANGNTLAVIRMRDLSSYRSSMQYGTSFSSLSTASTVGSYYRTTGELTFTDTQIIFTNTNTNTNYNNSWTLDGIDVNSIASIRANMRSNSTYTSGNGGGAGGYLKVNGIN